MFDFYIENHKYAIDLVDWPLKQLWELVAFGERFISNLDFIEKNGDWQKMFPNKTLSEYQEEVKRVISNLNQVQESIEDKEKMVTLGFLGQKSFIHLN